jgi:hypothetical protein
MVLYDKNNQQHLLTPIQSTPAPVTGLQNCPSDCSVCVEDGVCDTAAGENVANCVVDCGAPDCDLSLAGDDHDYLVSEIFLPDTAEAAQEIGVDLSGDGNVDNRLGSIVSMLAATSPDFDVNEDVNGAIARGEILLVLRLRTEQFPDDTEIRCNMMMTSALSPDVDLDGDGIPDVISVGLRIESAVPVTVVGP